MGGMDAVQVDSRAARDQQRWQADRLAGRKGQQSGDERRLASPTAYSNSAKRDAKVGLRLHQPLPGA